MITTKNTATVMHGFFAKKIKGVELTEVSTTKSQAKYLERHGWEKRF